MKLQSVTSTNDFPLTLTAPSPPENVKPVSDTVEPKLTSNRRIVPSLKMTAPESTSVLFEEPATLRVVPLDTDNVRDKMTFPCQLTAKLPGPSHNKASDSSSASEVVATANSSTVVGHRDAFEI